MKIACIIISIFFLFSCSNHNQTVQSPSGNDSLAKQKFFPVTEYLEGEIFNIKKSGINPLKYTTVHSHTDSVWIKIEDLDSIVAEFLSPRIDSTNLVKWFSEKSFMDQSLNAVTFTFDTVAVLPDSITLKHWDVYIDPKTSKVKRIYMVKAPDKTRLLQLTWVSGQWCKITTIGIKADGMMDVEKEEKLTWDF